MAGHELILGADSEWAHLALTEERYVEGLRTVLEDQVAANFAFLGFLYRGVALKESRRQAMVLSDAALNALGIDHDTAERFLRRLVKDIYLKYYGSSTTINNLFLDTETAPERVQRGESIHLSFDSDKSSIELKAEARKVMVSSSVATALGIDLPVWRQISEQARDADDDSWPIIVRTLGRQLSQIDDKITDAEHEIVRSEYSFLFGFGAYVLQSDSPNLREALDALRIWLRAFQALFMFMNICGRHWATVPVLPPFAKRLTDAGLPVPHSGVTAISNRPIEPSTLKKAADAVSGAYPPPLKREIEPTVDRIATFVEQQRQGRVHLIKSIFPKWEPDKLRLPVEVMPNLGSLLQLAQALIGEKHEGRPLSFILLCAPESSLLRYHSGSVRRPWALRSKQHLDPRDFPDTADRGLAHKLRAIAFAVQANALLLQEPGHALYFRPIAHQFMPDSIVEFVPFDARRLDLLLQEFTTGDRNAVAVYIRPRDARLFVDGAKVAFSDGKEWHFGTGLGGRGGSAPLLARIKQLSWASELSGDELARIGKVCDAVVHVAQREYGALFFLVRGHEEPIRSTVAPVWGSASAGLLEEIECEMLATLAGLDGETYCNVFTGAYVARQFLHVPGDRFLEFFHPNEDGNLVLNHELVDTWNDTQRQRPTVEDIDAVYRFGLRHAKALRVTWAYPDSLIAISVSSDGPIRLWARGVPERFT